MQNFRNIIGIAFPVIFLVFFFPETNAQQAILTGEVVDAQTGERLPGVNIRIDNNEAGTASDASGKFILKADKGQHILISSFIGYYTDSLSIFLSSEDNQIRIALRPSVYELNPTVITASKFTQKLSDVTVSMEVLEPGYIESTNTIKLDEVIRLVPGVDVLDGQANIRGGSGYTYGAGSRVMMLVDGLPMLSGDVNDIKWNYLPLENVGQVEIVKGASSALYGSSALNGVINVTTEIPGINPATKVELSGGVYARPEREEMASWWDGNPLFCNLRVSHLRKAGPVDITLGAAGWYTDGYRTDNYSRYARFTGGIRYNPPKIDRLKIGLQTSIHRQKISDFLLWTDADSGAWVQNQASVSPTDGLRFNIDPYVNYFDNHKGKHSLKTRYYKVKNYFPDDADKDNASDFYYGEYQYYRLIGADFHWTVGTSGSYTKGNSNLYGDHFGSSLALFTQLDKKFFERLSASLGLRWERFTLDAGDVGSRPVARAGVNYQLKEYTFVRASYGQGYRYPSMAEKYTATSLGGLKIFPNPDLEPETGWSAEVGLHQKYTIGKWEGFLDIAGFWMEYDNMMEFAFGIYKPDTAEYPTLDDIGFKSLNAGRARISGIDLSFNGQGKAGDFLFTYFTGYTYMDPVDLSPDSTGGRMLKYRYHHMAKGDLAVDYKKFSMGVSINFTSFIERIDPAFEEEILGQEFLPGLKEYRKENDDGALVVDLRLSWQVAKSTRLGVNLKNLFNEEYMGRPGDIQPPMNVSLQVIMKM